MVLGKSMRLLREIKHCIRIESIAIRWQAAQIDAYCQNADFPQRMSDCLIHALHEPGGPLVD